MQCEVTRRGRHLYVDDATRDACLAKPLIDCHAIYHQICQSVFAAGDDVVAAAGADLITEGFEVMPGLVPPDRCLAISDAVSAAIGETDRILTGVPIAGGLVPMAREAMETVLAAGMAALLERYYASHFRVVHCQLYRTEELGERHFSFRWHRDVEPMGQVHVMVYFTPSGPDDGGTQFLTYADTARLAASGYAFGAFEDRVFQLDGLLPDDAPPPQPRRPFADAGDAMVFAAPRILHRGVAPKRGHRDVLVINTLPSLVPWHETLAEFGTDHLFSADGGTRNTLFTDPFDPLLGPVERAQAGPVEMPPWAMFGGMLPA